MKNLIRSNDRVVNARGPGDVAIALSEIGSAVAHGQRSHAIARGSHGKAFAYGEYASASANGEFGYAIAYGRYGKVKGSKIGCKLVILDPLTEKFIKATVGENGIEAYTWYGLKDSQFIKA